MTHMPKPSVLTFVPVIFHCVFPVLLRLVFGLQGRKVSVAAYTGASGHRRVKINTGQTEASKDYCRDTVLTRHEGVVLQRSFCQFPRDGEATHLPFQELAEIRNGRENFLTSATKLITSQN